MFSLSLPVAPSLCLSVTQRLSHVGFHQGKMDPSLPQVWTLEQEQQHPLEAREKSRILGPSPDL